MRVLFIVTIAAAIALPMSAQAGSKGGGGGGSNSSAGPGTGSDAGARKVTTPAVPTHKAGATDAGKGTATTGAKSAAKGDQFLKLDGVGGESTDQQHK